MGMTWTDDQRKVIELRDEKYISFRGSRFR